MADAPARPEDLTVEEARDRWLTKQTDKTDRTMRSYRNRSDKLVEWADDQAIETVDDLTPFLIDQFDLYIKDTNDSPATIRGILQTCKQFLDYLVQIAASEQELPDAVDVPVLNRQEASSDKRLDPEEAERLLDNYRNNIATFGTPEHAFLELAWYTGARLGALRGLDLEDYDPEKQRVYFRHQPSTETPLKNKVQGERYVGISENVVAAIDAYIERERTDKRDVHGRRPLFCARQGRPSWTTLRAWSYRATQPCVYGPCPHDKDPATCSYRERNHSSKCPSSRSPHHLRTGSITWQLNRGLPVEVVAARVNASPRVIREFYDAADTLEEFEERRSTARDVLSVGSEVSDDDQPADKLEPNDE
ncbi:MAG: site-specific recombinase XerD [Haloarculaceae archaeon]|jgi:site-specific recombinase XerD